MLGISTLFLCVLFDYMYEDVEDILLVYSFLYQCLKWLQKMIVFVSRLTLSILKNFQFWPILFKDYTYGALQEIGP